MSLVISTGTNLGDRLENLETAKELLSICFELLEASRVYSSTAVDYLEQPDFLNQVLVFKTPKLSPQATIEQILNLEISLGRIRDIDKGPRIIDIDILFWNLDYIEQPNLTIPHPRLFERSFIVLPLRELKIFEELKLTFDFSNSFNNNAYPLTTE